MPKIVKPLSQTQISNAKAKDKDYKLSDGYGLYLVVRKIGTKMWRYDYTFGGKRNSLSLGNFPIVGLKDARMKRDDFRKLLDKNINPSKERKAIKKKQYQSTNDFEAISKEYLARKDDISENHKSKLLRSLEIDIFPFVKNKDISLIDPLEFLAIIKKIEERGAIETAYRVLSLANRVYRYAVTTGKASHNIIADIDASIALRSRKRQNYAHTTDVQVFKQILQSIDMYEGDIATKTSLQMLPYVFVRPFNIRFAEWEEFDFDKKQWRIPKEKMKMNKEHIVPLSDRVISIIKIMEPFSLGRSKYVFPSPVTNTKPLSENTLNYALKRLGFDGITVAHGFRHSASTLLHEHIHEHNISSDAIEMQMSHTKNDVKSVYNKALYINERTVLMQWYSDFLDNLKMQETNHQ